MPVEKPIKAGGLISLLTPTNVLLALVVTLVSTIGATQAEALKYVQIGVNQALTQGAALMERVNGLMREQVDRKTDIAQINQRIDKMLEAR
jgi:hypothetical protein